MGLMKYLNKLMFIDGSDSSNYSLDDVLGKAVMNPVLGAPELTKYEFGGKDKDRDLAYLSLGYLSNIPEKDIDTEKLKESNPEAYESFKESVNKLSVLQYYYGLFENMANNWRISKAVTRNRMESVTIGNLTSIQGADKPIQYLRGEFFNWMNDNYETTIKTTHTCGLSNYFDNALKVLRNYSSAKEFSKIEAGLKNKTNNPAEIENGMSLFFKACKVKAKQLENDGADCTKYFNTLLAQGVMRLYNTVKAEDDNEETTNELVAHYLVSLEGLKFFNSGDVEKYLPCSVVKAKKDLEKEALMMHVDLSGIAQVVKAEG